MEPRTIIPRDKFNDVMQKEVSKKLGIDLDIVEDVLSFTFSEAKGAFKRCKQVEINGLGVFKVVNRRLKAEQEKVEDQIGNWEHELTRPQTEARVRQVEIRLALAYEKRAFLKSMQPDEYPYVFS